MLENLRREMKEIKASRDEETRKVQQESDLSGELQGRLAETLERIEQLNTELNKIKKREDKIRQMADTIQTIQYTKIQESVISDFLVPKDALILDYLKRKTKNLDEHVLDRIPTLTFAKRNDTYTIILVGIQAHHQAFKHVLQRILTLSDIKQRAIEFYQRHLIRIIKSINQVLFQVEPSTQYWKQYSKIFYGLLKAENEQYFTKFKDFVGQKTVELSELFVLGDLTSPWADIRKETDSFMEQHPFINEIERLKHEALDKFIEQNISVQRLKIGKKPTQKSIDTIQYFIEKMKNYFREDRQYTGYKLKHFGLIPALLQRLMIYYCCFTVQLPLYESSKELLKEINKNTVTTISTSTGSGKKFIS
jgi:hypothetical protein